MASPITIKLLDNAQSYESVGAIDEQDTLHCIEAMLKQEEHYLCDDYLDIQATAAAIYHPIAIIDKKAFIDETCRSKMCEWIYHVIDSTRLQRESASVAMSFLDRFLSSNSERASKAKTNRKEYQLAAITCLYIAVKVRAHLL